MVEHQPETYRRLCGLLVGVGQATVSGAGPDVPSAADWGALGALAVEQGVAPLLFRQVRHRELSGDSGKQPAPDGVRTALEKEYFASAARNALMMAELQRILRALAAAEIPVVVLKGAALSRTLYPEVALRPMNDLDLLVHRQDLNAAVQRLRGIGYVKMIDNYVRLHTLLHGGVGGETAVELHWELASYDRHGESQPTGWFWQQAQASTGLPDGAAVLSPTGSLLYLAVHLALQHGVQEAQLVWFYDIYLLVSTWGGEVDWAALRTAAERFGWQTALGQALTEVKRRFGGEYPQELQTLTQMGPDEGRSDLAEVQHSRGGWLRQAWNRLSWADRMRLGRELLFPSRAYVRWRYGELPGGYLRRWADLASEGM